MVYPQFALDLSLVNEPNLENFIVGRNAAVMDAVQQLVAGTFAPMTLYVWGRAGAGKTHILRSLAVAQQACLLTHELLQQPVEVGAYQWFLVDDVNELNATAQVNLFHLFNALRSAPEIEHRHLIVTANCAPIHLPAEYLPDLRTRLGWDLVCELHVLSDEEKVQVLTEQAAQRGLTLGSGVVEYMLRYSSRDLSKLHAFLVQLDKYSLQKKSAVTIPLLKEWLAGSFEFDE